MTKFTWNEENTSALIEKVQGTHLVTQETLKEIAEELGHTARGVGSKVRQLVKTGAVAVEVQKASDATKSSWSQDEEAGLVDFLNQNEGEYTYTEISATFLGGKFTPKQVQGKVLSLELTDKVKKADKVATKRGYTEAEEVRYIELAEQGKSLEDIAEALGRPLNSIRGKGLSLHREKRIVEIPHQASSNAKGREDWLAPVGDMLMEMTVAQIAEATNKSERGIKNTLTRRGLSCADHNGATKREKLDSKAVKAE